MWNDTLFWTPRPQTFATSIWLSSTWRPPFIRSRCRVGRPQVFTPTSAHQGKLPSRSSLIFLNNFTSMQMMVGEFGDCYLPDPLVSNLYHPISVSNLHLVDPCRIFMESTTASQSLCSWPSRGDSLKLMFFIVRTFLLDSPALCVQVRQNPIPSLPTLPRSICEPFRCSFTISGRLTSPVLPFGLMVSDIVLAAASLRQ